MKPMIAWEMEAVFIFTGTVILLVAVGMGILIGELMYGNRKKKKRSGDKEPEQPEPADPCDTCPRWYECNGVDLDCPIKKT